MTGKERIIAALKGEKPDKIPIMLHNFMMAAEEAGHSMEAYRNSPALIAETHIRAVEKYQYDGVLIDVDTVTLAGAIGVPVDFPVHEPARSNAGNLETLEVIKDLKPPQVENYKYIQIWLEATRQVKEQVGENIFVRGNCDQAPFSLASMMRGTENWMMDLYMAEGSGLLEDVLGYCTEASKQFIQLMAQTGCDMVSNGDSPAGPDMIPPELYRRYAWPYEKQLVDTAHDMGVSYLLHICGDTSLILPDMVNSGADAVELDYKTDVNLAFDLMKDKCTFFGNVDPSGILAMGTPEQVQNKTIALLDVFSKKNRFVLNAGCAIPSNTPEENIKMFIDTAREYTR
jgi:uroporphyrinogen decarboxylase